MIEVLVLFRSIHTKDDDENFVTVCFSLTQKNQTTVGARHDDRLQPNSLGCETFEKLEVAEIISSPGKSASLFGCSRKTSNRVGSVLHFDFGLVPNGETRRKKHDWILMESRSSKLLRKSVSILLTA